MLCVCAVVLTLVIAASTDVAPLAKFGSPVVWLVLPWLVPLAAYAFDRLISGWSARRLGRAARLPITYRCLLVYAATYLMVLYPAGWAHSVLIERGWQGELLVSLILLLAPAAITALAIIPWAYSAQRVRLPRPKGTFRGWLLRCMRSISVPLGLFIVFVGVFDLIHRFPAYEVALETYPSLAIVLVLLGLGILMILLPRLVMWCSPTHRLDDANGSAMLKAIAAKASVRVREVRVWDEGDATINAYLMGQRPGQRRVFFTKGAIEILGYQGIAAVFAHELGHIRHRHLWWIAMALVTFVLVLHPLCHLSTDLSPGTSAAIFVGYGAIWWYVLFGFLSRRFELEADQFASELVGDPYLHTLLFVATLVKPRARQRGGWRHFSLDHRIRCVQEWRQDPATIDVLRAGGRALRWCVVALLLASLILFGLSTSWELSRNTGDLALQRCSLYLDKAEVLAEILESAPSASVLTRNRSHIAAEYRDYVLRARDEFTAAGSSAPADELSRRLNDHVTCALFSTSDRNGSLSPRSRGETLRFPTSPP